MIDLWSMVLLAGLLHWWPTIEARKHHLEVKDDARPYIALSTFGFYTNGHLNVQLSNLRISEETGNELLGLTLDKTNVDDMNPYMDSHQNKCLLEQSPQLPRHGPVLFFILDLRKKLVHTRCSAEWYNHHIYRHSSLFPMYRGKRQSSVSLLKKTFFIEPRRQRRHEVGIDEETNNASLQPSLSKNPFPKETASNDGVPNMEQPDVLKDIINSKENAYGQNTYCSNFDLSLNEMTIDGINYYNMTFSMFVASIRDEGLYNLYFHDCPNYHGENKRVSFMVDIEENNNGNYLSAGEMPLPALYLMMSLLFFLSGLFWIFILKKSKHTVYKIHYIMAVLVFLKSLSLLFHSINYHFIEIRGEHVETWAILYYITHLLKGAVLFITIVLIGTGWTFIKHILSDKDKKIFMFVIPLQVLANVAEIIIEESEESDAEFRTWHNIFIFVDLLCCGAILFPIVWSIRHLHDASATDGKAAINLRKLKLFRQFYIMIVCYIYFTRIIVYLLKMTMAFQYAWLDEMFREMATYVFFVLTGYKFRPLTSHPYFTLDELDENGMGAGGGGGGGQRRNGGGLDDDEVEIFTKSAMGQTLHRVRGGGASSHRNVIHTSVIIEGNDEEGGGEREKLLIKRESSHEYD